MSHGCHSGAAGADELPQPLYRRDPRLRPWLGHRLFKGRPARFRAALMATILCFRSASAGSAMPGA
jgi:hypothetical protein